MADTISFTRDGSTITVTPIPGTVKAGGGDDDRGGGTIPSARAGIAKNGSCEIVITSASTENLNHTLADVTGIISPVGPGTTIVQGAGRYADIESFDALVDVEISGDSVQTASINWKGTYKDADA